MLLLDLTQDLLGSIIMKTHCPMVCLCVCTKFREASLCRVRTLKTLTNTRDETKGVPLRCLQMMENIHSLGVYSHPGLTPFYINIFDYPSINSLRELHIHNYVVGEDTDWIPIGSMRRLRSLSLRGCTLYTVYGPPDPVVGSTLACLTCLEELDLYDTQMERWINQPFRDYLCSNTMLRSLNIGRNNVRASEIDWGRVVGLESLDVSDTKMGQWIDQDFERYLRNNTCLTTLSIGKTPIYSWTIKWLRLKHLRVLNVSGCYHEFIGDHLHDEVCSLTGLVSLNLGMNILGLNRGNNNIWLALTRLRDLKRLDLSSNCIAENSAALLGECLMCMTGLVSLELRNNPIAYCVGRNSISVSKIFCGVAHLANLEHLGLRDCQLECMEKNYASSAIINLNHLVSLDIGENTLGRGEILEIVGSLRPSVRTICIEWRKIEAIKDEVCGILSKRGIEVVEGYGLNPWLY